MKKNVNINKLDRINGKHIFIVCLFLSAMIFRFFASQNVPINSYEAEIILRATGQTSINPDGISIFESILIKLTFFIFGESDLGARIWPIIIGSLLVLWPLYLGNKLRNKHVIGLSFLIAIDPFMIVNSIQIGSNIFSVFACAYLAVAILKKNHKKAVIFLFLLLISGRGLFLSLLIGLIFTAFYFEHVNETICEFCRFIKNFLKKLINKHLLDISLMALSLVFIAFFLKIDLSATISDLLNIFRSFFSKRILTSSLFAFPIIFLSYQPFLIFSSLMGLLFLFKNNRKSVYMILTWVFLVFFIMLSNPFFKNMDMLWISFPLLIYFGVQLPSYFDNSKNMDTYDILGLIIFSIGMISFCINFFILIRQGISGLPQSNTILSIISILIIIISLGLFSIYQFSFKKFISVIFTTIFIIIVILQIGTSIRASGLTGSAMKELLWAGEMAEREQLLKQVEMVSKNKGSSNDFIKIGLIDFLDPSLIWELRRFGFKEHSASEFPKEKYDILLSAAELTSDTAYKYFGQKFIKHAYPDWINHPLINIISADYWSWNTVRRSRMDQSYYFIYLTAE
jgi:hypothetical protein